MQGTTNISEGTNILRFYTYVCFEQFFWKIKNCHWIINVKIFFRYGIWENI